MNKELEDGRLKWYKTNKKVFSRAEVGRPCPCMSGDLYEDCCKNWWEKLYASAVESGYDKEVSIYQKYYCTSFMCNWEGETLYFDVASIENRRCPKCGSLVSTIPGSCLKKMFTVTKLKAESADDVIPMVENLLERFDALPEFMVPTTDWKNRRTGNHVGERDYLEYWEPLRKQIEVVREALKELKGKEK